MFIDLNPMHVLHASSLTFNDLELSCSRRGIPSWNSNSLALHASSTASFGGSIAWSLQHVFKLSFKYFAKILISNYGNKQITIIMALAREKIKKDSGRGQVASLLVGGTGWPPY